MLPGFRFLFAAIVLSMSILVFGLGAAALLRAAHEQFASIPSRRPPPETTFAQQSDATQPVLAMLRVDTPFVEKASTDVPAAVVPAEPAAISPVPAEPEKIAAVKPEESSPQETARPEIPESQIPARSETVPPLSDTPASTEETRIAAIEQSSSPPNEAAPPASEPSIAPASPETDIGSTKIATLGGPPISIEPTAKATDAKADESAVKKRLQERRAAQRRRIAARARLARQVAQQAADPFAQSAATVRSR